MGFFHRQDAFLFANALSKKPGSIEITAVLPAALESESLQIPLCGLVHPRLCRMPDYAASSVALALEELALLRHNFGSRSRPDRGLFGPGAGSR